MIRELEVASDLLKVALERYLHACVVLSSQQESKAPHTRTDILLGWALKELPLVASYETIIQQAKAIIGQVRNSSTLAPVNALPDEVLSDIFRLVLDSQPYYLKDNVEGDLKISGTRYPEYLSHVCAHWRRITIDLPSLWSHIDVVTRHNLSQQLYARSETFVSRSQNLPISLRINDCNPSMSYTHPKLHALCTSISTRIQDLRMRRHHLEKNKCQLLVLRACLPYCTPGVLRSLSLRDDCRLYTNQFIDLAPQPHESETRWLDLPTEFIEELMLPVQRLYLRGCFFHWNSGAYIGLTELHLRARSVAIAAEKLVQILSASPQLCVLHFGVSITHASLEGNNPPVLLPHLEILNLCWLEDDLYPVFFQLLSPNAKSLQLSLQYTDTQLPRIRGHFFRHSNITQLYMDGPDGEDVCLSDIVDLLPELQTLVLANFQLYGDRLFRTNGEIRIIAHDTLPKMEELRLIACSVGVDETRLMIRRYSIRKMVLWGCDFRLDEDDNWDDSSYAHDMDHPERNEIRSGYFAGTGVSVRVVNAPLPECHLSNDWEEWHPWESWP